MHASCCEPAVRGFFARLPGSCTCTHLTPPERALLRTKGFGGASGEATTRGVNLYADMVATWKQGTQAPSKTDENLKHVVSTACRPRVFQLALFKGFPNILHITLPTGHTMGTNQATLTTTTENPPSWRIRYRPREICILVWDMDATLKYQVVFPSSPIVVAKLCTMMVLSKDRCGLQYCLFAVIMWSGQALVYVQR